MSKIVSYVFSIFRQMMTTRFISKHLHSSFFGGNWTGVCLKEALDHVSFNHATAKSPNHNSILGIVYHMSYYVKGISEVLSERELMIKDEYSWDFPSIADEDGWQDFKADVFDLVRHTCLLIEQMDASLLDKTFVEVKYGTYAHNLWGLIEHTHYHLGQISLLKKQSL